LSQIQLKICTLMHIKVQAISKEINDCLRV
jgi:hypothetical protein